MYQTFFKMCGCEYLIVVIAQCRLACLVRLSRRWSVPVRHDGVAWEVLPRSAEESGHHGLSSSLPLRPSRASSPSVAGVIRRGIRARVKPCFKRYGKSGWSKSMLPHSIERATQIMA